MSINYDLNSAVWDGAHKIIAEIAADEGLLLDHLLSARRFPNLVAARKRALGAVRKAYPWLSWPQLGAIFRRDHTSLMYLAGAITKPWQKAPA